MSETKLQGAEGNEEYSALFGSLILQQAQMATLLLGKMPHPESGEAVKDLDAAKLFIDHLAMLEVKTQGNLSKEESGLLKQTLMGLRMAYVDAVESPKSEPSPAPAPAPTTSPSAPGPEEGDHRTKFSKKY